MKKVICIGSATRDIFLRTDQGQVIKNNNLTAKRLLSFELGAKVYINRHYETVGGSAVNVAAGLSRLGIRSFVFARVARGEVGKWITKRISRLKAKKNYLQQTGGKDSATSLIITDEKTKEHVIFRGGDSVKGFSLEKALDKFRERVDWVFLASQKDNWEAKMEQIISFVGAKKARLAINPSSWQIEKGAYDFVSLLDKVDILFLNRDEAIGLIKNVEGKVKDEPKFLLKKLASYGSDIVVITDAEKGAYVARGDKIYSIKAQSSNVLETTGAGDAFASGFLANYIRSNDEKEALCWGILNSAKVINEIGGVSGLLKEKELKYQAGKIKNQIKSIL